MAFGAVELILVFLVLRVVQALFGRHEQLRRVAAIAAILLIAAFVSLLLVFGFMSTTLFAVIECLLAFLEVALIFYFVVHFDFEFNCASLTILCP